MYLGTSSHVPAQRSIFYIIELFSKTILLLWQKLLCKYPATFLFLPFVKDSLHVICINGVLLWEIRINISKLLSSSAVRFLVTICPILGKPLSTIASVIGINTYIFSNRCILGKAVSITESCRRSSTETGLWTFSAMSESLSFISFNRFLVLHFCALNRSNMDFKNFPFPKYSCESAAFCSQT